MPLMVLCRSLLFVAETGILDDAVVVGGGYVVVDIVVGGGGNVSYSCSKWCYTINNQPPTSHHSTTNQPPTNQPTTTKQATN